MAKQDRTLYVLEDREDFRWLWTLSTNRSEAWSKARKYTREPDGNWKKELRVKDGVHCIPVRLIRQ